MFTRAVFLAVTLVAAVAPSTLAQENVVSTIERLEDELNTAFNAYDAATMDRIWGEELVFISPNGAVATKAQRLAGLKSRPATIPVSANESIAVNVYGDVAVAIVVSSWTGVPNATKPIRFRATHVWTQTCRRMEARRGARQPDESVGEAEPAEAGPYDPSA